MQNDHGIVFKIKKFAIHDGPGIRTTIFLKGCPLTCWWCHNPEGLKMAPQPMPANNHHREIVGREVSLAKIMTAVEKDLIFFDESGGGVTFSGGEPLLQPHFLAALLAACHEREIHTAVDTSGAAAQPLFEKILDRCDLFLFDLKIMDPADHRHYTGVSNETILNNLDFLARRAKALRVRFPLVPGITDSGDNIVRMARWLIQHTDIRTIDILPFHHIAADKYRRLGLTNPMDAVRPPTAQALEATQRQFQAHGIETNIGG